MSYTTKAGVTVICASDPEGTFKKYHKEIEKKILSDGYIPKTSMENLIVMVILSFDSDDNYGEYDPETGFGGYGEKFSLEECFRYVKDSGGYAEFDYYA